MYKVYDNLEEYIVDIKIAATNGCCTHEMNSTDSWAGDDLKKTINYLETGDFIRHEQAIEEIINQLQIEGLIASGVPLPSRSYDGSRPNITAYLTGQPKQMYKRRRDEHTSINTPLQIYVETSVSSSISEQEIVNRGIAVCAFVLAMSAIRPVELYSVYGLVKNSGNETSSVSAVATKISNNTIDTGRMMYCLTSRSYSRRIGLCLVSEMHKRYIGAWYPISYPVDVRKIKELLNIQNDAIYIPGIHTFDLAARQNPISWVREKVIEYSQI